ncbi:MAG: DMT family transporter [Bacteroidota bacterium]
MPFLGELSALLTALFWSGSSIVFAAAISRIGSVQVNVTRLIFGALFLLAVILVFGFKIHLSSSQYANLAISGFLGLVFGDTFLFQSYVYNGARLSMLIMSVAPAISAILAYFFIHEVLSFWGILGIFVTMAGIAIVVTERKEDGSTVHKITTAGIVYGVLGAFGQGAGLVVARLAFDEAPINGIVATFVRIVPSLAILVPLGWMTKRFVNPIRVFNEDRRALKLTIAGAILGPCLGITFSLIAVAHTSVGIAATLMATSPIMMLPMAKTIQKETLTWKAIAGAFVAVAGVSILFLR